MLNHFRNDETLTDDMQLDLIKLTIPMSKTSLCQITCQSPADFP